MAVYEIELDDGRVFEIEGAEGLSEQDLIAAINPVSAKPADTFGQNALDVAGEFSAGANRSLMWPIDTAISGINMATGSSIPTFRGSAPGAQGGFMDEGTGRDIVRAAGETAAPFAMGATSVAGRNLGNAKDAVVEFLGAGSAGAGVRAGQQIDPSLPARSVDMLAQSPEVSRDLALARNSSDPARVPYRVNQVGRPVKDAAQQKARAAGLPEDLVAIVAGANAKERKNLLAMTRIMGEADPVARSQNYPRNVLGDSLAERVDVVINMNRQARQAIGEAERTMARAPLSQDQLKTISDGPMKDVLETLQGMGVRFDPAARTINFQGSALELADAQKLKLKKALGSLAGSPPRTALDVHRKKQALDELINDWNATSPGKAQGRVLRVLKQTRGGLNDFLRSNFDDYAAANDAYSETVSVLNDLNKLVGRSADIRDDNTGPALARMSRIVLSNYQNSDKAREALSELDRLASKSGQEFGDDFMRQNVFLDESEKLFGTPVRRSLQGEMTKAQMAANAASDRRGLTERTMDYAASALSPSPDEQRRKQLQALIRLISSGDVQ